MFFILVPYHILCYDIWFYITHLILHLPRIYFIHKIHHRKPYLQLKYSDTNEAHWIENVVQPIGILIPCFTHGFYVSPLIISFIIISIRGLMRHDDRFSWLMGNHHLLHHKYPNYNFGEYWIDKTCCTLCPHKHEYIYGNIYT